MAKTFIFRKPKFMRNDAAMAVHLDAAGILIAKLSKPNIKLETRYNTMNMIREHWDKAADEGGFLNTRDLMRWLDAQNDPD